MKEVHILLVEDNEGDIVLTREVFKTAGLKNKISVVRDGEKALQFLYRQSDHANAERPDLVLLDINIPKINGKEILEKIKTEDSLKDIPVVMLTTSSADGDVLDAYRNRARCFITKPLTLTDFAEAIADIDEFSFSLTKK